MARWIAWVSSSPADVPPGVSEIQEGPNLGICRVDSAAGWRGRGKGCRHSAGFCVCEWPVLGRILWLSVGDYLRSHALQKTFLNLSAILCIAHAHTKDSLRLVSLGLSGKNSGQLLSITSLVHVLQQLFGMFHPLLCIARASLRLTY